MITFDKYINTVFFTSNGVMRCSVLNDDFYSKIIFQDFDFSDKKTFDKICSKIIDLYSQNLLDKKNLVLKINTLSLDLMENFDELINILETNGYSHIELVDKQLSSSHLVEKLLKEDKAVLCAKLDYGENLDDERLKNLRNYLNCAKDKRNIIVHCVIRDLNSTNFDCIDNFIKLMYRIGINVIGLRVDEKYLQSDEIFSKGVTDLFINFFKKSKQYSFFIDMQSSEQNTFLRNIIKHQNNEKYQIKHHSKIQGKILKLFSLFSNL